MGEYRLEEGAWGTYGIWHYRTPDDTKPVLVMARPLSLWADVGPAHAWRLALAGAGLTDPDEVSRG